MPDKETTTKSFLNIVTYWMDGTRHPSYKKKDLWITFDEQIKKSIKQTISFQKIKEISSNPAHLLFFKEIQPAYCSHLAHRLLAAAHQLQPCVCVSCGFWESLEFRHWKVFISSLQLKRTMGRHFFGQNAFRPCRCYMILLLRVAFYGSFKIHICYTNKSDYAMQCNAVQCSHNHNASNW